MALFYSTYDVRTPGQDYKRLWARLVQLGAKRVLESVWAVSGAKATVTDIHNDLLN